jgi:hypothetical protein
MHCSPITVPVPTQPNIEPGLLNQTHIALNLFNTILKTTTNRAELELSPAKCRTLKLHAVKYCIAENQLYWKDPLGFLLVCLVELETLRVIEEFHEGVYGGHHAWRAIAYKILRARYYWPKLFSDVNTKVRACNPCQIFAGK